MKAKTLKLCFPVIAITVQNNGAWLIIPPFLQSLNFPVSSIGYLVSLFPVLSLVSRIPAGMVYKQSRARMLITVAILIMGVCNFFYSLATDSVTFALVHGINGFLYGAVTTLYMAFYVDSLPPDENRTHAMGYYVGSLAVGYSTGSFLAGYVADRFGYDVGFYVSAFLSLVCLALFFLLRDSSSAKEKKTQATHIRLRDSLKAALDPNMAEVVVVALFLNFLNQLGGVFLPLYGLAVGMTLTQVGVIRAFYSLCNAVTRPLSGYVVTRFGYHRLSYGGMSLQSALMMVVPLFTDFGTVLALYISAGFMRAVAVVSNAVALVKDVDETKVPRGVASGIYNAAGDLGNILGPSVGGLIAATTGIGGLFVFAPLGATALFFIVVWGLKLRASSLTMQ